MMQAVLEYDSVDVRRPARSDEKIGALENAFATPRPWRDPDLLAGTSLNAGNVGFE